jgi:hypothetical protein
LQNAGGLIMGLQKGFDALAQGSVLGTSRVEERSALVRRGLFDGNEKDPFGIFRLVGHGILLWGFTLQCDNRHQFVSHDFAKNQEEEEPEASLRAQRSQARA